MSIEHRPRKRFGQNFLHDANIIARIIDVIHPKPEQQLVEIGPGQGALTSLLLNQLNHLDVVELDRDLVSLLEKQYPDRSKLTIHSADALKFDYCQLAKQDKKIRLVGNLPYYISTPLIFHLLDQRHCIQDMYFMLQKEVVERMAAQPSTKSFGRLTVMVQLFCQVEKLFTVPPGAFNPPPKVDSMIVRLTPFETPQYDIKDQALLRQIVNQAFSQRRKTLRNALKKSLTDEQIRTVDIDPGARPETISVQGFVNLANLLATINQ
ncbi:MAG: 16S rRNA (adenine(1518)-N(6)/adenine(1519)-N(6))-dimethyltransferase RsmA [Gammaproteobacteria bacterium]|nr:16S rRNA (adenine(1518)-N(6)/adenine(1519)-N(6))-dimethyltransferase RsmA [Gammaproteobacteria bacterium]